MHPAFALDGAQNRDCRPNGWGYGVEKRHGNARQTCGTGAMPGKLIRSGMACCPDRTWHRRLACRCLVSASMHLWLFLPIDAPGLPSGSYPCMRRVSSLCQRALQNRFFDRSMTMLASAILSYCLSPAVPEPWPGHRSWLMTGRVACGGFHGLTTTACAGRVACLMNADGGLSWSVESLGCRPDKASRA